jgi:hypothetical protein
MDEVDSLLKKLPGADPSLRSDPDAPPPRPAGGAMAGVPRQQRPAHRRSPPPGPTKAEKAITWSVLGGGIVLGVALTQWPYASACGFSLLGYLAAVLTVIVVAGWVFIATWFHRMGFAHVVALILGFWGVVLAAEQVLPRIGYAEKEATWVCREEVEATPVPVQPAAVPAIADSADTLSDSLSAVADSADTTTVDTSLVELADSIVPDTARQ